MRIIIVYGTREGHTLKIAEHLAEDFHARGIPADVRNARDAQPPIEWTRYTTAIVAASVHVGRHEPEVVTFVKRNRTDLERLRAVFLSVSLSERGVEDGSLPEAQRRAHAAGVKRMIDTFTRDTGWMPARVLPVAGALAYRRYNVLVRWIIKRIAASNGAPTDTSRNYDLTDWPALDRFAAEMVAHVS